MELINQPPSHPTIELKLGHLNLYNEENGVMMLMY